MTFVASDKWIKMDQSFNTDMALIFEVTNTEFAFMHPRTLHESGQASIGLTLVSLNRNTNLDCNRHLKRVELPIEVLPKRDFGL